MLLTVINNRANLQIVRIRRVIAIIYVTKMTQENNWKHHKNNSQVECIVQFCRRRGSSTRWSNVASLDCYTEAPKEESRRTLRYTLDPSPASPTCLASDHAALSALMVVPPVKPSFSGCRRTDLDDLPEDVTSAKSLFTVRRRLKLRLFTKSFPDRFLDIN